MRLDGILSSGFPSKMYSTPSFTSPMPGSNNNKNSSVTKPSTGSAVDTCKIYEAAQREGEERGDGDGKREKV